MGIALCCLFFLNRTKGQDIHFSQIDVNPILFNPAYSGFFDGNGRFGIIYRNQWASVSDAFQTMAVTAEVSLKKRRYQRDGISLGFIASTDRAGTLHYGTTMGTAILAYYRALGRQNDAYLSFAVETGYGQAGYNPSDASLFDASELLENTLAQFVTLGTGIAWFYQPNDMLYFKIGASARNLNRPNISYLGLDDAYLERKYNVYARAEYRAWNSVAILPVVACQWQRNYSEYLVGCDAKWYLSENSGNLTTLSGGLHYRVFDAMYTEFALEYNAFLFSLNYDVNLSKLTPASHTVGAFEVGMIYRLNNQHKVRRKAMPCPII